VPTARKRRIVRHGDHPWHALPTVIGGTSVCKLKYFDMPPSQSGMAATKKPKKQKNSLVANINRKKAAGTSHSKEESTVSPKAYKDMQEGWPKRGKKK